MAAHRYRRFVDVEWALGELREYLSLHERIPLPPDEVTQGRKNRLRGTLDERRAKENVVRAISEAVYGQGWRHMGTDSVRQLIWELTDGDEVRQRLGLDAPAPVFEGSAMHPWVWEAARPHWNSGNHHAAVWAAAINVNSRTQTKVGRRDLGESKLLNEAFSTEPAREGRPRLRLCDDSNPDLFRDMHTGASALGRGLFSAVRNPLNHVDESEHGMGEAESLEALAGFSLLARWIDRAHVVTI